MDGWERRGAVIRHARESGDDVAAAATDGVKETTTRDGQAGRERVACTAQVRYHTTSLEEDRKAPGGCGDAGHGSSTYGASIGDATTVIIVNVASPSASLVSIFFRSS